MNKKITKKYIIVYLLDATLDFDKPYTFLASNPDLFIGQLIEVPFGIGNSLRRAVIFAESDQSEFKRVKSVSKIIFEEPVYRDDQLFLAKEMKRRYFCTVGRALKTISPPTVFQVGRKTGKACRLKDPQAALELLEEQRFSTLQQERVIELLLQVESALCQEITQVCQVSSSVLNTLQKKGFIEFFQKKISRNEEAMEIWHETPVARLNDDQEIVYRELVKLSSADQQLREALLFGVTGSGKTEVYLRFADEVLKDGKTVIILVPEISLTPLMISRFVNKFKEQVAIWHSRLTLTQRFEQWQKILNGEKNIVVGARSAIFSPLQNIGLIIIDEEQESSYVSESIPKYKAHEIARIRAIEHHAVLLLGSATPSIETYHRTVRGVSKLLTLPKRAKPAPLPKIDLVQMKNEMARADFDHVFSLKLLKTLEQTFAQGGQAMLFLNRRGFNSTLQCKNCGHVVKCPHCEIPMTRHLNKYDKSKQKLICHYCGQISPVITTCPECGENTIEEIGIGTQMVEQAFRKHFPECKTMRMDFDTVIGNQAHQKILSAFGRGEVDCLIGTQMIAKGHDFQNVRTVGIISSDSLMYTGNYKSEERAFQLLTQASGRAGRSDKQGDVIIQGFNLNNYVIRYAARQDYLSFYKEELKYRYRAAFPPFFELGLILIQSKSEKTARQKAVDIFYFLNEMINRNQHLFDQTLIFSPCPAPIIKLRGKYRYRIIIKSDKKEKIARLFNTELLLRHEQGVQVNLDINPEQML